MIVLAPRKQYDDAIAAREAEMAKQLAAAQEARKQQEAARALEAALRQPPMNGQPAQPGADARLDALESRMRRLEAAIDSILKKLDEM